MPPRPSLAPQRRAEILDAFEVCVMDLGLDRSSLDRIAERAGMNRQLVLHYFGSRAGVVEAAVARMVTEYRERMATRLADFDEDERLEAIVAWMFLGDFCEPRSEILLGEIKAHAQRSTEFADLLRAAYGELEGTLCELFAKELPGAPARQRRETAFSLIALCFGAGDLLSLGFPRTRRQAAYRAAEALIATLWDEHA